MIGRVRWVSWPGMSVDLGSQETMRKKLEADYGTTPVFLQPDIADLFFNKVSQRASREALAAGGREVSYPSRARD
jgi:hypothetical protein